MAMTEVVVDLTDLIGDPGNRFSIVERVSAALKAADYEKAAGDYKEQAFAGDFDQLLKITRQYVTVKGLDPVKEALAFGEIVSVEPMPKGQEGSNKK